VTDPWPPGQARDWYERQPWLVGCNYIPSTAINQLEMWQPDTFDLATIDRELGWARGLGFNALRVFLHDLLWQQDALGFASRVDAFLTTAALHGMRTMLVLFEGVWDPRPALGKQPEPRPRVHNSGWVQSPGAAALGDAGQRDRLRAYVTGAIDRFRDDPRVLAWDLFNEPDNPNTIAYGRHELSDKAGRALDLLTDAHGWAREVRPVQPITMGVWRGRWLDIDLVPEIDRFMLTHSDVVSFHCYGGADDVRARLDELAQLERPMLLTEYLARAAGSTFEAVLPIAKERGVGAFNWGLVSGKTQTIYPWDSWRRAYTAELSPWFHDIFRPDSTPYRQDEVDVIRSLTGS
jgi:hypothetical protein